MTFDMLQFEKLVRDYIDGKAHWNLVHQCALGMEYANKTEFPTEFRRPLEELQAIFLVDEKDGPQFRADRGEIVAALAELDRLRSDVKDFGRDIVAQRELVDEIQQEQSRRLKFLARHQARKKRKKSQRGGPHAK
jgi:hypothetical protein